MDYEPLKTIREMADDAAAAAKKREDEAKAAVDPDVRKDARQRARLLRDLEQWFRTRNGYE